MKEKTHFALYTTHPNGIKIYRDFPDIILLEEYKKENCLFDEKCLTCQQVKNRTSESIRAIKTIGNF